MAVPEIAPAMIPMALPPFRAPGSVEAEPVPVPFALSTVAAPIVRFAVPVLIPMMPPVPVAPAVTLIGPATLANVRAMFGVATRTVPPVPEVAPALAEMMPIVLAATAAPTVVAVDVTDRSTRPPLPVVAPLAWVTPIPVVVLGSVRLIQPPFPEVVAFDVMPAATVENCPADEILIVGTVSPVKPRTELAEIRPAAVIAPVPVVEILIRLLAGVTAAAELDVAVTVLASATLPTDDIAILPAVPPPVPLVEFKAPSVEAPAPLKLTAMLPPLPVLPATAPPRALIALAATAVTVPAIICTAFPPFKASGSVDADPLPTPLALNVVVAPNVTPPVPALMPMMPPVPEPVAVTVIGVALIALLSVKDAGPVDESTNTVPPVPAVTPALAISCLVWFAAVPAPIDVAVEPFMVKSILPPLPVPVPFA